MSKRANAVLFRWGFGVVVVGGLVPVGLVALFLFADEDVENSFRLVVGRGELFLIGGTAVLTSVLAAVDRSVDAPLSTESALTLIVMMVLPSYALWALGTSRSVRSAEALTLSNGLAVWVGLVALGLSYACSLVIHVGLANRNSW